ncbi:hypothetical protein [Streptomyces boluensis]|uniref:Uncharacterized protein n=1 Tax=Streptomyces boluensis TaxID=1775135 RepID=A0A964URC5_9ACTN|nr:hypothetical protein [Streptomyces boluensis]NBE53876.1 hypothetical protein [Streptomyces boluensis]
MSEMRRRSLRTDEAPPAGNGPRAVAADGAPGTVLAAAASASTCYTAAAAKGAATALVRMFVEQGVFGIDVLAGTSAGPDPQPAVPDVAEPVAEPTPWERARSAVDLAERQRRAAAVREPEVTTVRLMGEIMGRTGPAESAPAATPVRAA